MRFKLDTIPIGDIDLDDETYRITTDTAIDAMKTSIESIGLINPPIVLKVNSNSIVLSGFRRIEACRNLGWGKISARILDFDSSLLARIKLAISENSLQRPLNLVEKSRALQLLFEVLSDDKQVTKEALALGLSVAPVLVAKLKGLCRYPKTLQAAVTSGAIPFKIACELARMEPHVQHCLTKLFCELKIGLNKQREILTLMTEIGHREHLSPAEIINDTKWVEILRDNDIDKTQKQQKIRQYLKQRRFPVLTQAETMFKLHRKKLKLGNHIDLLPPPYFEGNTYTFSIRFRTVSELNDRLRVLKKNLDNPSLKKTLQQQASS